VRFAGVPLAVRLTLGAGLLVASAAGCAPAATPGQPAPSTIPGTGSPVPSSPDASGPNAAIPASASPPAGSSGTPSASAGPTGPTVPIDPTLLAILPSTVGGQVISEIPEIESSLQTDPDLVANAAGLAVGLGVNSGTGDFAYVAVVDLKPLVFTNAWFVSWRQSYDESACSQSNGLAGATTTTIGGRTVFVGTCNGGARTYHVHLANPDRIVSITSVGSAEYGEQVIAGLKA
jgi:hypothetical protein